MVNNCNCKHNHNSNSDEPCCRCDSRLTKADKLRSVSNEKLAEFLSEITGCENCDLPCQDRESPKPNSCYDAWLEWLQSPLDVVSETEEISVRS